MSVRAKEKRDEDPCPRLARHRDPRARRPGFEPDGRGLDQAERITIPGIVLSSDRDKLIIRTDDHGHRMPFDVGPATSRPDGLRKGAHVSVTYHPLGPTGQAADTVQLIERGASARSQASFKVVTGPAGEIRVGAR